VCVVCPELCTGIDMAKKVVGYVKLQIIGGQATAAPPVGPALSQKGVNIAAFIKDFNSKTQKFLGAILPTVITVYSDKSFSFITKSSPTAVLLKQHAKLDKGSSTPGKGFVGSITPSQIQEIAKIKLEDLNCIDIEKAIKMVEGSARSMGLEVKEAS